MFLNFRQPHFGVRRRNPLPARVRSAHRRMVVVVVVVMVMVVMVMVVMVAIFVP